MMLKSKQQQGSRDSTVQQLVTIAFKCGCQQRSSVDKGKLAATSLPLLLLMARSRAGDSLFLKSKNTGMPLLSAQSSTVVKPEISCSSANVGQSIGPINADECPLTCSQNSFASSLLTAERQKSLSSVERGSRSITLNPEQMCQSSPSHFIASSDSSEGETSTMNPPGRCFSQCCTSEIPMVVFQKLSGLDRCRRRVERSRAGAGCCCAFRAKASQDSTLGRAGGRSTGPFLVNICIFKFMIVLLVFAGAAPQLFTLSCNQKRPFLTNFCSATVVSSRLTGTPQSLTLQMPNNFTMVSCSSPCVASQGSVTVGYSSGVAVSWSMVNGPPLYNDQNSISASVKYADRTDSEQIPVQIEVSTFSSALLSNAIPTSNLVSSLTNFDLVLTPSTPLHSKTQLQLYFPSRPLADFFYGPAFSCSLPALPGSACQLSTNKLGVIITGLGSEPSSVRVTFINVKNMWSTGSAALDVYATVPSNYGILVIYQKGTATLPAAVARSGSLFFTTPVTTIHAAVFSSSLYFTPQTYFPSNSRLSLAFSSVAVAFTGSQNSSGTVQFLNLGAGFTSLKMTMAAVTPAGRTIYVGTFSFTNPSYAAPVSLTLTTQTTPDGAAIEQYTTTYTVPSVAVTKCLLTVDKTELLATATYQLDLSFKVPILPGQDSVLLISFPSAFNIQGKSPDFTSSQPSSALIKLSGSTFQKIITIAGVVNPNYYSPSFAVTVSVGTSSTGQFKQVMQSVKPIVLTIPTLEASLSLGSTVVFAQTTALIVLPKVSLLMTEQLVLFAGADVSWSSAQLTYKNYDNKAYFFLPKAALSGSQVRLTATNFVNPPSTAPFKTLQVALYNSDGMFSQSEFIDVRMTQTTTFSLVLLSQLSNIASSASSVSLQLSPVVPLASTDILEFQLPGADIRNLQLPTGVVGAVVSIQTGTVSFSLASIASTLSFTFKGIVNPSSTQNIIVTTLRPFEGVNYAMQTGRASWPIVPASLTLQLVGQSYPWLESTGSLSFTVAGFTGTLAGWSLKLKGQAAGISSCTFQSTGSFQSDGITGVGFTLPATVSCLATFGYFQTATLLQVVILDSSKAVSAQGSLVMVWPCPGCKSCLSTGGCSACLSAKYSTLNYLHLKKCVSYCPDSFFPSVSRECQSCPGECTSCSSLTVCLSCAKGFKLNGRACDSECGVGRYLTGAGACLDCAGKFCQKCNSEACLKCDVYSTLATGSCTLSSCLQNCTSCSLQPSNCTACLPGYGLLNNTCQSSCPNQYLLVKENCILRNDLSAVKLAFAPIFVLLLLLALFYDHYRSDIGLRHFSAAISGLLMFGLLLFLAVNSFAEKTSAQPYRTIQQVASLFALLSMLAINCVYLLSTVSLQIYQLPADLISLVSFKLARLRNTNLFRHPFFSRPVHVGELTYYKRFMAAEIVFRTLPLVVGVAAGLYSQQENPGQAFWLGLDCILLVLGESVSSVLVALQPVVEKVQDEQPTVQLAADELNFTDAGLNAIKTTAHKSPKKSKATQVKSTGRPNNSQPMSSARAPVLVKQPSQSSASTEKAVFKKAKTGRRLETVVQEGKTSKLFFNRKRKVLAAKNKPAKKAMAFELEDIFFNLPKEPRPAQMQAEDSEPWAARGQENRTNPFPLIYMEYFKECVGSIDQQSEDEDEEEPAPDRK